MIHKRIFIVTIIFPLLTLIGCDTKEKKRIAPKMEEENIISEAYSDSIQKEQIIENSIQPDTKEIVIERKDSALNKPKPISIKDYPIHSNLKTLLAHFTIGEKQTKEEIMAAHLVPNDALKIIKNVTKTSENELAIEWKSTWLIEKISDVKFKDGHIKVDFKEDMLYTSGDAIGIKYEGKIYTDLKIKNNKAYIPSVKEYSWRIVN